MRHPDYDRAFHDTPDYIRSAIELGMRKGQKKMKLRQKFMSALTVAAALAVILGAAAFGASRLAAPKPDNRVASRPRAAASERPGASASAAVLVTPDPTPEPTATPTATPAPAATAASALPETVYYTQGGLYFHIERECSGLENGIEGSVDEAYHAGKEPCPICLAGWSFEVNAVPDPTPEPTPTPTAAPTSEAADEESATESVGFAEAEAAEAAFPYAYLGLASEDLVYCAPDDPYFHFSANCSQLTGQITVVTSLGAALRDHAACEACKPTVAAVVYNPAEGVMRSAATGEALVYYNPNGAYFHVNFDCSGMLGAQLHTLQEAVAARKFHCPVCIGESEKLYWLPVPEADSDPVYTSPDNGYYHRSGDCFRLPALDVETYGAVQSDGVLAPGPHCLPELAGDSGGPRCFVTDWDEFYHTSSTCETLSGDALDTTELEAQAEGRVRCQACLDASALPAYGEQFTALFGSWLNGAYPGWIFERADVCADGSTEWYVSTNADARPNPAPACRVTAEPDGGITFELGGASMEQAPISHDFLNALPEAILTACERDAMELPTEAGASVAFDSVSRIRIEADADGKMTAFEIEFGADSAAVTLRWQRESDGYALVTAADT